MTIKVIQGRLCRSTNGTTCLFFISMGSRKYEVIHSSKRSRGHSVRQDSMAPHQDAIVTYILGLPEAHTSNKCRWGRFTWLISDELIGRSDM